MLIILEIKISLVSINNYFGVTHPIRDGPVDSELYICDSLVHIIYVLFICMFKSYYCYVLFLPFEKSFKYYDFFF